MTLSRRDMLRAGAFAAVASPFASMGAFAKAPLAGAQTPGVFRTKVGNAEVTAISGGTLQFDLKIFPDADPAQAGELLAAAFPNRKTIPTSVNAFVVNTGDKLVLIDTGTAGAFGPTLGRLPANLKAAGIDPASIDAVLLTHLHPDHEGGLLADNAAAFANAEVMLSEAESKFWFDEGILSQAPEGMKPMFAMARGALSPYQKAGKLSLFSKDAEVVPGISSIAAPGHTPGHTMYRIGTGADSLLIWGDIIATVALQFPHPDWGIVYDADRAAAAATRRKVFDMTSADKIRVAGAHIAFPGIGNVVKTSAGYGFAPGFWDTDL